MKQLIDEWRNKAKAARKESRRLWTAMRKANGFTDTEIFKVYELDHKAWTYLECAKELELVIANKQ